MMKDTTWEKDASLVVHRLNTIDDHLKETNIRLTHLEKSVWTLQAKAAVIGGISGLAISGISLLFKVQG